MASAHLKRNQQAIQPYGQGGVFGLSPPEIAPRDSRKRRKNKHTCIKHTLTPYFDGHLWRKYGQKVIKDAPYPRCSYREDRHCQASKLVQQVTHDDPPLYEVTYTHEHTCNAAPVPVPGVDVEDERPAASGVMVLTFGSSDAGRHHCRDTRIQLKEEQQEYHQHLSPFSMMNLNHPNNSQPHAIPSCVVPLPPTTSSSPFPIIESSLSSSPTTPWTDSDDDILTWDWDYSPTCDLDDHLQFGDHVQFPWKSDGSALANLAMGMEVWRV